MFPIFHLVTKAIRTHHRPRVQNDTVPHTTTIPNVNPRMNHATIPYMHISPHKGSRPNLRSLPHSNPLFNHYVRPQSHSAREMHTLCDNCSRMDARDRRRNRRSKQGSNLSKSGRGMSNTDANLSQIFGGGSSHNQSPCLGLTRQTLIAGMDKKGNFVRASSCQIRHTLNRVIFVSLHHAPHQPGELPHASRGTHLQKNRLFLLFFFIFFFRCRSVFV